jgi:5-methylcytosine-specific restriction endonuclease McrA
MLRDQGAVCAYCTMSLNGGYHVDHMIPLSRGGRNDWTNLAISCRACNLSKGSITVEEFFNFR